MKTIKLGSINTHHFAILASAYCYKQFVKRLNLRTLIETEFQIVLQGNLSLHGV